MEKGDSVQVFVIDGDRVRSKSMKYLREDNSFIVFFNVKRQIEEYIPIKDIKRIERTKHVTGESRFSSKAKTRT